MLKKSLGYVLICSLFFSVIYADKSMRSANGSLLTDNDYGDEDLDGFLNIKFAHERQNEEFFGPKNSSACGLTPVITIGNLTLESDFYYGHQFSLTGVLAGERHLSRFISDSKRAIFHDHFRNNQPPDDIRSMFSALMANNINRTHLYRTYSRGIYENKMHNFRVVFGDTMTRNQIGFQQALSGLGVSIFRQNGNGSIINKSSPIVFTRVSKVECKLGDDILCVRVFAPGVYSIDDLPEEAKLPGVTLKISDQLNRSDVLQVNYFGAYELLAKGKDDFDITFVYNHKWDIDNPHASKYSVHPRFSASYRYGMTDNTTVGAGLQYHSNSYLLDYTMIFKTNMGIISPNIAYSYKNPEDLNTCNTLGAGLYYAAPKNNLGVLFEAFVGIKGKGFTDLNKGSDLDDLYYAIMNKLNPNLRNTYKEISGDTSSRQVIARVYTKPICGIVPAFIFNGQWSKTQRLREYTLSFITKPFNFCTVTISAGISYDDPYKGVNQKAPDRRLTVACTIPIGKDWEVKGTYSHHDEERLLSYGQLKYTPSALPGLEITAEESFKPGFSNPVVAVKYDSKYFDVKVDEALRNSYGNGGRHVNQQRLFFGTSISPSGFKAYQKSNYNVLRSAKR